MSPVSRRLALAVIRFPAALLSAVVLIGCGSSADTVPPPRPVLVVQPQAAGADYLVFAGEVRARHEPALAFRIGGKITRRHVDVGERVREGQLLAELDPGDVRLQVTAAQAQLASAQADLALARSERDRHRELLERQLVSASQFDTRESQFRAAEARANQVRAQLEVARNQAGYAELRASDDGVIVQRLAEAGQVVAAGQAVYLLAADGEREIAIDLPEQGIERFQVGQPVAVGLWSRPDQRLAGSVRELAPSADTGSRTFAARIRIEGGEGEVDLGQTARVMFARNGGNALLLPLPAVSADAGRHFVWVVDPASHRVARREVEIGPFADEQVPVTRGLEAGEWVVAAGGHLLGDGQTVRAVDRENRAVALGQ